MYLGIDLGVKTMGLAITDETITIVSPLENYEFTRNNYQQALDHLSKILNRYKKITDIVVGYPTKMNGTKTEWTSTVGKFCNSIKKSFKINVHMYDERMSTVKATTFLKEDVGLKMSKVKKIKDMMSASIILNEYLRSKGLMK